MTEPTNPIAQRMIQADRVPTEAASRWLGWGIGLVCAALLTLPGFILPLARMAAPLAGAAVALEVAPLALCFVLSAILMMWHRRGEDYTLVRLTGLPAQVMVEGYNAGILYRLRIVRAAAVGLPAGWGVITLLGLAIGALPVVGLPDGLVILAMALAAAIAFAGGIAAMVNRLTRLLAEAGVWVALRHTRRVEPVVGAAVLAALAFVVGALVLSARLEVWLCAIPAGMLALLIALARYEKFFLLDAMQAVDTDPGASA